ncbi:MAG: HRDC domain-containing protein, partial [Bacteroidota bacterium]
TQEQGDMEYVIHFLRGEEDAYIKSYRHQTLPLFGQGSDQDNTFWAAVIRQTLLLGLASKDTEPNNTLQLTQQGKSFLDQPYGIMLHKDHVYAAPDQPKALDEAMRTHDQALLTRLQELRKQVGREKGVPTYAVFQDASLEDMALAYPSTLEELAQISGLSLGKAKKFGQPFIELIQQYIRDNNITTVSEITVKSIADKSKNKVAIIQQIDRKIDLEEIAASKSLTLDELLKEMEQLCYAGTKLNIGYYINTVLSRDQQEELYDYFMKAETDNIQQAQIALGEEYEENELRLMRIKFMSEVAN